MKKSLVICVILLLSAVLASTFRAQPARKGFSVQGVGLGWTDEQVEALVGRETPSSDCPLDGSHFHHYQGGLGVLFDKLDFEAEVLCGSSIEFDGEVLVQQGDLVENITAPPVEVIMLENGGRLVARPVSEYFFDEAPEFGWKYVPMKGLDEAFRVAYRYESDDGSVTDAYDLEVSILAFDGVVEKVQLRSLGH
ncbi:MAG: hypothetical protein KC800_10030 [Candidatus Eremiobacteraeota bacterium]|nr:hypothetical protein [Candidatus Eremiobacteraeota bacterium]